METAEMTKSTGRIPINIPYPQTGERSLHIGVGACHLRIRPGGSDSWISGVYYGPTDVLPLEISSMSGEVKITQRQDWAEITRLFEGVPTLELTLGAAMPYALMIETGASDSELDLGGLPLTRFTIKQGAGKVAVNFSTPNPTPMDRFSVGSGASEIDATNLANANFSEMVIEGGAASFKLDFGGILQRDARVKVSSAMSSAIITIPNYTAAKIRAQTIMGSLRVGEGFANTGDSFWSQKAMAGAQPTLNVQVTLTMGSVSLDSR